MEFKTPPFQHQLDLFNRIKDTDYFAILWEMGTGKTKLAIDLLRYKCMTKKKFLRILIIAPNEALINWHLELEKHSNLAPRAVVLQGTKAQRIAKLKNKDYNVFIINYEGLLVLHDELLHAELNVLIADESQLIKNHKAKRTKVALALSKQAQFKYILSGTPILNSGVDIFAQYYFLDSGLTFGKNFYAFRNTYFEDKNKGWRDGYPNYTIKPNVDRILNARILKIADIKKKHECLTLPPRIYNSYFPPMGDDQFKAYVEMREEFITFLNGIEGDMSVSTAANALTKIIRLQQISSGFLKDTHGREVRFKSIPKLDLVSNLVEELAPRHKIIIWAVFVDNIKMLFDAMKPYNPALIYGGNVKDRQAQIIKFETDATCRVMVANPKSAGRALNFVAASYAIYYSQNFSLEHREQSEARCHRSGSEIHEKITYIDVIHPKSVDEIVVKSLKDKIKLSSSLLQISKEIAKQ